MELAIVLLPLLLLVLGIAEFGRTYSQQLAMQHAAREAARYVALAHDDPAITVPALIANYRVVIDDNLPPGLDLTEVTIGHELCGGPAPRAVITIDDTLDLMIPWITDTTVDVAARAEMPCEG